MAIFSRLKFWKKEEEEEPIEPVQSPKPYATEMPEQHFGEQWTPFQQVQQSMPSVSPLSSPADKELQIISAKLDTLKAMLDDINHRLARLEKLAGEQTEEIRWR